MVPLLQRVTLEKPQSNQRALAPTLGTSPRLGVPERRLESVGRRPAPWMARGGGPPNPCRITGTPSLSEVPSVGARTGQPHGLQKSALT